MDQRFATRQFARLICVGLMVGAVLPLKAGAQATAPATATAEAQDSPAAQAAWSALQIMRDYVHAAQLRNPEQRRVDLLKMRKALIGIAYAGPQASPEALEALATLWPSVISHYVDGLRQDRLVVQSKGNEAVATIVAVNPKDQQLTEQLSAEITKRLQQQGLSGQDLRARSQVLLKRKLAEHGVGYPIATTIQLRLVQVDGAWKVRDVDMMPPARAVATQPATQPSR